MEDENFHLYHITLYEFHNSANFRTGTKTNKQNVHKVYMDHSPGHVTVKMLFDKFRQSDLT